MSEPSADDDQCYAAKENQHKKNAADKHASPQVRGIGAGDFQLPGGEFDQLTEGAVLKRRRQTLRDELDWQITFMKSTSQGEVIRDCTAPVLDDFAFIECLAPDCS